MKIDMTESKKLSKLQRMYDKQNQLILNYGLNAEKRKFNS